MFIHNIDPVLLSIFGMEIRYYGLVFVIGFMLIFIVLMKQREKLNLTKDDVYDYIFYLIIFTVVGARIFEILFYEPYFYFGNPIEMLKIWKGGLSFHGGLSGIILWNYIFTRKKILSFYDTSDILVIPAAFTLFLGRIANFINGELVGKITDMWWAVKFQDYEGFRHPTQIYEALKNLFISFLLIFLRRSNLKKGTLSWLFVLLYGILRFFIEFLKEQSSFIFGIPVTQVLSGLMIAVSLYFLLRK